jgi:NAD-dependent histone deacetylase SIR2
MKKAVAANEVPKCHTCNGLVKPDIVFFGEALPSDFILNRTLPAAADLLIIMGTSLTVQPFASLAWLCKEETPRVLINLTRAGNIGSRPDDVVFLGDCDEGVRKLAEELGWLDELEALWAETAPAGAEPKETEQVEPPAPRDRDQRLHDEVERLAEEVEQALHVSTTHDKNLREELREEQDKAQRQEIEKAVKDEKELGPAGETTLRIPVHDENDGAAGQTPQSDVANEGSKSDSQDKGVENKDAKDPPSNL